MSLGDIDFLIIGATKSATTWLQRALQSDPAVFMPDPELHYFSRELARGDDWYWDHFANAASHQRLGEKSNSYLEDPAVASRIAQRIPKAKLIAQLRSPVERAYSDYCMMYRRGDVGRDIERYLDPKRRQETRLLRAGLYGRQLAVYYDHFPREQMLVTFYEAIRTEPDKQIATVRRFLELPPVSNGLPLGQKVKDKTTPMLNPWLRRLLSPAKPLVAPVRKLQAFQAVHGWLASDISYPPLTDAIRDKLVDYYAADVEALGARMGRDLSGWLAGVAPALAQWDNDGALPCVKPEPVAGLT
jgi:hypothetical protein